MERLRSFAVAVFISLASMVGPTESTITLSAPMIDTSIATVVLTDAGEFNVEFCGPSWLTPAGFPSAPGIPLDVTAVSGGTVFGYFQICYTDTTAYRDGFTVAVHADDFNSAISQPYGGSTYSVPASGFTITAVYGPLMGQAGVINPGGYPIGNISADTGGGGLLPGNASMQWNSAQWSGLPLSDNPRVNVAVAGAGTGTGAQVLGLVDGTVAHFLTRLSVPAGAAAGTYVSEVTLTLAWSTP